MAEPAEVTNLPTGRSREVAAVAPTAGNSPLALIPRTPEEIKWTIGMVVGAGLAPDSFNGDQKKMAVAIMQGLEIGVGPMAALNNIAIINGRPAMYGDLLIALVQRSGLLVKYEEVEIGTKPGDAAELDGFSGDYGFEVRMHRKGVDGPFVGRFTVGDAKRAKLWMNARRAPWMQYPKRMLRMRAANFAIRAGFADCLAGMVMREEAEDLPPAPEITDSSFLDGDAPALEHEAVTETPRSSPEAIPETGDDDEAGLGAAAGTQEAQGTTTLLDTYEPSPAGVEPASEPESTDLLGAPVQPLQTEDGFHFGRFAEGEWLSKFQTNLDGIRDEGQSPAAFWNANKDACRYWIEHGSAAARRMLEPIQKEVLGG